MVGSVHLLVLSRVAYILQQGRGEVPDIWVFGKIAYLLYPRPTMTTRLVKSKQPTYLPPPEKPRVLSYL